MPLHLSNTSASIHFQITYANSSQSAFWDNNIHRMSTIHFGGSNRRCIGAAYAMYEMKIVLANILRELEK